MRKVERKEGEREEQGRGEEKWEAREEEERK